MDFDFIVIGAGPAGLSAAAHLQKAQRRVLVIERESFGGRVGNLEWIDDYPAKGERIEGPKLANALVEAARGAKLELGEVIELESYSGCRSVTLADGKAYTAPVVIIAGGIKTRPLGIPGEDKYQGKGIIQCAFCDGGLYSNKPVAVCGGGDAGIREALYLSKFASVVHVLEIDNQLSARADLQASARANAKLDIRLGCKPTAILGADGVTGVEVETVSNGTRETLGVIGVLVHAGFDPASGCLEGVVELDERGYTRIAADGLTGAEGIFSAGDIRAGSRRNVMEAIADGMAAAAAARALLDHG
ncbi:MAG: NAD(P)/FAD-dependent oxidoreductase [Burkholderiales bacterium]